MSEPDKPPIPPQIVEFVDNVSQMWLDEAEQEWIMEVFALVGDPPQIDRLDTPLSRTIKLAFPQRQQKAFIAGAIQDFCQNREDVQAWLMATEGYVMEAKLPDGSQLEEEKLMECYGESESAVAARKKYGVSRRLCLTVMGEDRIGQFFYTRLLAAEAPHKRLGPVIQPLIRGDPIPDGRIKPVFYGLMPKRD